MTGPSKVGGQGQGVKVATFHQWKYSHYFVVVDESEKNMRARCTLCSPSSKPLLCARNTTSNFKKHLDTVHKTVKLMGVIPEGSKRKRSVEDEVPRSSKRQATLQGKAVSPAAIRGLVAQFIVNDMLPLSTVESPSFRKLINALSSSSVQLPDRKSLSSYLEKAFESMIEKVKDALEGVDHVSTTADIWTAHHRSYLGMTAHWIDHRSFKRQRAAIACVRMIGRHTYDVLAASIEEIHRKYRLSGKVTATVTDNGSNFVKAFASFASQLPGGSDGASSHDNEEDDDVTFSNLHDLMVMDQDSGDDDLTQVEYELPPHQRCAAHTLNLVASKDVDKHLSSCSLSRSVYRSAFGKCVALWNKTNRSTLVADKVEKKLKKKLLVPSPTRWNSYFDAICRVVENSLTDINELCSSIELRGLSEKELSFLQEYIIALKPLSTGLDILQGEDYCYYGTLLPTLETICKKTKASLPKLLTMTTGLVNAIDSAIKDRFANILDSQDAIIAAVTFPKFKLKWVESQEKKDAYKKMVIDELRQNENEIVLEEKPDAEPDKSDSFYEFDSGDETCTTTDVEREVMEFLRSAKSLECLDKFPKVKQLFLKFNTTIPSSAPVERLFSLGNVVFNPRRNRLSDDKFQQLLLMRYNKDFVDLS